MIHLHRFKRSGVMRHDLRIVALLLALCLGALPALAQINQGRENVPIFGALPTAVSAASLRGAPLFWASDITSADDLPAYKSIGLNTVVVRLSWDPNFAPNDLTALNLAPQRTFAEAAAKAGLNVIYALPPTPQGMEFKLRIAGDSPSYGLVWTTWASGAIRSLRDTPGLIGWMLPDDPRALPIFDDMGLRRWIERNYASVDVLNAQWNSAFGSVDEVTLDNVEALIKQQQTQSALLDSPPLGQLGTPNAPLTDNVAFHPAALALAAYRWEAYRELLVTWIGVVRGADANHLLFSGELPDYAQLLSMPTGVDVMMPALAPSVIESDIATHNPQAIDIARRGGRFAAMPVFSVRGTGTLPVEALPELSKRWMQEACARGAVGVALDSWPDLKTNLDLRQSLLEKIRELNGAPARALWGAPPVATTAVVLTPLADGATLGFGPIALGGRRGLYGWAQDLVPGEPSNLVWSLRWGTAFGGVDYLAPEDLNGPLDQYNAILAPQMLSCSLENQTALTNYVSGGGVLVADLGLGALQSGGQAGVLPPAMRLLFGVPGAYSVRPASFDLKGAGQHEVIPKWSEDLQKRNNLTLTDGDAPGSFAFGGPTGFSVVPPVATIIGLGPQIGTLLGNTPALLSAPLTVNNAGRGYAVFAPFRMWANWRPGHLGFDSFFGPLMARGATLAVNQNAQGQVGDVTPASVYLPEGLTRFPEIVNRPQDVTFIDHDAPGQTLQLVGVETTGVGDWLWSGGIAQLPNAQDVNLVGGRPTPIDNPSPLESRIRPLRLFASTTPGTLLNMKMEPISVQNLGGGPLCGQVISNTRAGAEIYLWPNANSIAPAESGDVWQPVPAFPAKFRLTVYSSPDGVAWKPGTRVRAKITSYALVKLKKGNKVNSSTDQKTAVVNAYGRATWEFESASCRVEIEGQS